MAGTYATIAEKSLRDRMRGFSESDSVKSLASKKVVTISPTSTIKSAVELMVKNRFRRVPVTDSGTGRLLGIFGSSDIVDLVGGGKKYQLIRKAHSGNFLSAINDSVRRVMNKDVLSIDQNASLKEALRLLLSSKRGGLVLVDKKMNVNGIITERDFLNVARKRAGSKKATGIMTSNVISATPGTTLGDATKIMIRNSFRRLPIVSEDKLVGMVTTRTIIDFIGENGAFDKIVENDIEEILNTRVSEVMGHQVASISKEADLAKTIDLMISTKEGTVCVLDSEKLVGIVTERDIAKSISP
jgi:CBS domain-containing protein